MLSYRLDRLIQHTIKSLDEGGRVFECHAFEEQGLIEEEPRGIFHPCVLRVGEKLLDDLVVGVDLEGWSGLRNLFLAHGSHHLAHAGTGLVFVRHDDGRAFGEAGRGADFLDGVV